MRFLRRHLVTVVVAMVTAAATAGAPAIAGAIVDADTVDGFDAVGCKTAVDVRGGDLVATCKSSGKLPNNIIKKAPNANKLDGYDASELTRAVSATGGANASTSPVADDVLTATAPTEGGLLVGLSLSCISFSGTTNTQWNIVLLVDGANAFGEPGPFGGPSDVLVFPHADVALSGVGDSASMTAFVPVGAGSHSVGYSAERLFGDGSLDCDIFASSLFVPFGDDGSAPSAPVRVGPLAGGNG